MGGSQLGWRMTLDMAAILVEHWELAWCWWVGSGSCYLVSVSFSVVVVVVGYYSYFFFTVLTEFLPVEHCQMAYYLVCFWWIKVADLKLSFGWTLGFIGFRRFFVGFSLWIWLSFCCFLYFDLLYIECNFVFNYCKSVVDAILEYSVLTCTWWYI